MYNSSQTSLSWEFYYIMEEVSISYKPRVVSTFYILLYVIIIFWRKTASSYKPRVILTFYIPLSVFEAISNFSISSFVSWSSFPKLVLRKYWTSDQLGLLDIDPMSELRKLGPRLYKTNEISQEASTERQESTCWKLEFKESFYLSWITHML